MKVNPFIFLISFGYSLSAIGQLTGTNLMEYHYGKLPGDTTPVSGLYDRAVVSYNTQLVRVSATLEQFNTPYLERNYLKLTQYAIQYTTDPVEVKIGNFHETIGRGLLLRSFEVPGALLEDLSYRSRHYFNHDLLGAMAKVNLKNFNLGMLYGRPLNYVFPPGQAEKLRRPDIIEALFAGYALNKQKTGLVLMRHQNDNDKSLYGMVNASGTLYTKITYHAEMAKELTSSSLADFGGSTSYGIYASIGVLLNRLGFSAELKDYRNFVIGEGVNEPPALIKEHSYRVLNRSTHVLQSLNEKGYQTEAYYMFTNLSTLTFNHALALNYFGRNFLFREFFLEYDFSVLQLHDIRLFTDYALDPFKDENVRISTGVYSDWKWGNVTVVSLNYEFQTIERTGHDVRNHVFIAGYGFKNDVVVNLTTETSTDPFLLKDGNLRIWIGANLKLQLNNRNNFQLFAGSRRGGPACNAGICYEVLDFRGVEARLTSRF